MVVVQFSEEFEKELKKQCSKTQAKSIVRKLSTTKSTEGKYIAIVGNVLLKEKRMNSFRFYFVQDNQEIRYLSEQQFKEHVLQFIALSKKNNQQKTIDRLKEELKEFSEQS